MQLPTASNNSMTIDGCLVFPLANNIHYVNVDTFILYLVHYLCLWKCK